MSKKTLLILILILILGILSWWGYSYLKKTPTVPNDYGTSPTNFISQFNPFGNSTQNPPVKKPPVDVSGYTPDNQATQENKLTKISSLPIAGFGTFLKERLKELPPPTTPTTEITSTEQTPVNTTDKKTVSTKTTKPTPPATEFALALRYIEKQTGSIYQTFVDKIEERKFADMSIPRIHDAYWSGDGMNAVVRYLKSDESTIATFVGTMPKEVLGADSTESIKISGYFLPEDIKDLSLSPDQKKLFYLFNSGENQIGIVLNFSDKKKTQLFDSPFMEWLSWWGSDKLITLTTKANSSTPGYSYILNTTKKGLTQAVTGISGLTTLESKDGKIILYSDNTLSLYIYDIATKNSSALSLKTLPEKCAWGGDSTYLICAVPKTTPLGAYPESWYQGEVSFSDQFWKIDLKNGNTSLILDPETFPGGENMDVIKLSFDKDENYLFFINKKDDFLWKLDLN